MTDLTAIQQAVAIPWRVTSVLCDEPRSYRARWRVEVTNGTDIVVIDGHDPVMYLRAVTGGAPTDGRVDVTLFGIETVRVKKVTADLLAEHLRAGSIQ